MAMLTQGTGDWPNAAESFLRGFSGGMLVGLVLAALSTHLLTLLPGQRMAEVTVTVTVAYLAFVIGELVFRVSGVVAVVCAALVFSYDGRTRVSPETWSFLARIWKQLGYWASSLLFLLAALRIPDMLSEARMPDLVMLGGLVLSALVARGLVVFGFMPLMSALGMAQKVELGLRLVILWGGLRGAVSLALALAVLEHPAVPPEVKRLVSTLVTAFVLFTLFVNGLTLRPLIRRLGIDRLPPVDRFLRSRAIAHGLGTVKQRLSAAGKQYRIDSAAQQSLVNAIPNAWRNRRSCSNRTITCLRMNVCRLHWWQQPGVSRRCICSIIGNASYQAGLFVIWWPMLITWKTVPDPRGKAAMSSQPSASWRFRCFSAHRLKFSAGSAGRAGWRAVWLIDLKPCWSGGRRCMACWVLPRTVFPKCSVRKRPSH